MSNADPANLIVTTNKDLHFTIQILATNENRIIFDACESGYIFYGLRPFFPKKNILILKMMKKTNSVQAEGKNILNPDFPH